MLCSIEVVCYNLQSCAKKNINALFRKTIVTVRRHAARCAGFLT
jgi:hypothetical protein